MKNVFSIFFFEGYVGVAPTVANLSKMISRKGYPVNIYANQTPHPDAGELEGTTTVSLYRSDNIPILPRILKFLTDIGLGNAAQLIKIAFFVGQFILYVCRTGRLFKVVNSVSIGVDIYGSIAALIASYLFRQKIVYLSLELTDPETLTESEKAVSFPLSCLAYQRSVCVIVQDEDRFETLTKYYQYKHPKVFYLPNSPIAVSSLSQSGQSSNYFREIFSLDEVKYPFIVAQTGLIHNAMCAMDLALAFTHIDQKYALVLHNSKETAADDPYINSIKSSNHKNLFLSLEPLPYDQIEKVLTSIDIGLAFYKDVNENFSKMAMASGKIAHYLQHGKPIITNSQSLSDLVDKYKFGIVIKSEFEPSDIEAAIQAIIGDYAFYSANARTCFEEEYDFSRKVQPLLSFLESLD